MKEIAEKVKTLNDLLDDADSKFDNLIDKISYALTPTLKGKIKELLKDILDNYDTKDKHGNYKYDDEIRGKIRALIQEIDNICNRSFWDRFKIVLGIGS